jgi:hypothetical protein
VIVRVIRVDPTTSSKRWMSRRINDTLRSIIFASSVIPYKCGSNTCQSGAFVDIHPTPETGTTIFDICFGPDWTPIGVQEFIRYMENSKNVVSAFLTLRNNIGTMHPCNTDPQLATSAT